MLEFNELFNEWAPVYDKTVYDQQGEYREVFQNYDVLLNTICDEISDKNKGLILEIGVGTGNLSKKLVSKGFSVIGIEPCQEMRRLAKEKLPNIAILDGHFLSIPIAEQFDSIVTSYAFHHLTYSEKRNALKYLDGYLKESGKFVIADTMYESADYKDQLLKYVADSNSHNLLNDLKTEYYEFTNDILKLFDELGYTYQLQQINKYVWVISAQK
ncbi:class I SAM-dependent methyltransferase [Alkaliphilus transvaalensis]|uniref:class I SAM-dependent methyltransferase n=1 Tax=Alkaliphilus transvaalensis TaxID=114628 RepID=UPI00047A3EF7|nr:class I SAM-dependent methyltransferase [Alkaliphilus transvaalensis]